MSCSADNPRTTTIFKPLPWLLSTRFVWFNSSWTEEFLEAKILRFTDSKRGLARGSRASSVEKDEVGALIDQAQVT